MAGKRVDNWATFDPKEEDKWRIKVAQDLHFKNFYRAMTEYFDDDGYVSIYGDELFETFYDEKHQPDGFREYRIRWRVFDITENSSYVVLKHQLDWQILKCSDKKVVVDGKKLTIQNMEIEITCKTYVMVNKKGLKDKKFLLPFAKLFFDRWFRYLYEGYKSEAKGNSKSIEEKIKALLSVVRYTDSGFEFHRQKGFENPNKINK